MEAKEKKKNTKWVRRAIIISKLKGAFVRSPMYKAVLDAAKVPYQAYNKDGSPSKALRYQWRCALCSGLFFKKKAPVGDVIKKGPKKGQRKMRNLIEVDHVTPVIDPNTGYVDLTTWADREFVNIDVWDTKVNQASELIGKLQVACFKCHSHKSTFENEVRREVKKERKKI